MTLDTINGLDEPTFIAGFGDVAEHSPWIAERAALSRPFADRAAMVDAFQRAIATATREEQVALIRAHPDLAGRARLAPESVKEQRGAGLETESSGRSGGT